MYPFLLLIAGCTDAGAVGASVGTLAGGRLAPAAQLGVDGVEAGEPGRDAGGLLDPVQHGLERLVAVAGDADHDRLVARDAALRHQLAGDRHRGPARGLGEDTLGPRQELDGVDDLGVADRLAPAPRLAHGLLRVVTVGRVAAVGRH